MLWPPILSGAPTSGDAVDAAETVRTVRLSRHIRLLFVADRAAGEMETGLMVFIFDPYLAFGTHGGEDFRENSFKLADGLRGRFGRAHEFGIGNIDGRSELMDARVDGVAVDTAQTPDGIGSTQNAGDDHAVFASTTGAH